MKGEDTKMGKSGCRVGEQEINIKGHTFCFPKKASILKKQGSIVFINVGWGALYKDEAKKIRDATARKLRKIGYMVKSETYNFSSLGYGSRYKIEANLPEWQFNHRDGWHKK